MWKDLIQHPIEQLQHQADQLTSTSITASESAPRKEMELKIAKKIGPYELNQLEFIFQRLVQLLQSYPFIHEGNYATSLVLRSTDYQKLDDAFSDLLSKTDNITKI